MTKITIPEGYGIAQLADGRWYPLEATRYYSAEYPEGDLSVSTLLDRTLSDVSFPRRAQALDYCISTAQERKARQQEHWQHLAVSSNVYPERCAHYLDLITATTGHAPIIHRWYDEITITVFSYRCSSLRFHPPVETTQWAIEEALAEVAEAVYASYQACPCSSIERASALRWA